MFHDSPTRRRLVGQSQSHPWVGTGRLRPILVFQNDAISRFTTTVLAIPLTTNLRRAALPSCVRVAPGEGGLESESVLLCHQLRVLDKTRLQRKLGTVGSETIAAVERCVLFTVGIV